MATTRGIKPYLGAAACLTLLVMILIEPLYPNYVLTDRVIVLLLALMSSFLGVDIFRQSSSQSSPEYLPPPDAGGTEAPSPPSKTPSLPSDVDWETFIEQMEDETSGNK